MTDWLLRVNELTRWSQLLDLFRDGQMRITGDLRIWVAEMLRASDPAELRRIAFARRENPCRVWVMEVLVERNYDREHLYQLQSIRLKVGDGMPLVTEEVQALITLAKQMRRSILEKEIEATIKGAE